MVNGNMLAMILAGGRGSRLHELTNKAAKPAVSFGGKYRIIDYPLSNCANSGVSVVGVLTQYESVLLNAYVAGGRRWGLDSRDSGVFVLPPREKADETLDVYKGTADAIAQNADFIDNYDPEYVLILSGDHIYKMDYEEMLRYHRENGAEATIAVIEVPKREAGRFGIMSINKHGRITEFVEKPEKPKSNLASMGIYIFNWKTLRRALIADRKKTDSSHDFGKDIIPTMLSEKKPLYAYQFKGYWKDVGTIDSLWEANMDLLQEDNALNMADTNWRIYTEDASLLPQYIGEEAEIDGAYITQGARVSGKVKRSVISTNCIVEAGAEVIDTVLLPGAKVCAGAKLTRALVADDVIVPPDTVLGSARSKDILLVSGDLEEVENNG